MDTDQPPDPPGAGRCSYYVPSKRRFCPLTPKGGAKFCREHSTDESSRKNAAEELCRVPCPYDTSHSVDLCSLAKHMRSLCNARPPVPRPAYTLPDCNVTNPPPACSAPDTGAEPIRLWCEEGLARSDPRLMLKPGELPPLDVISHDAAQPKLNELVSKAVAQTLRPIVELYLTRVFPDATDLQSRSLEELLAMVSLTDDFPQACRTHPLLPSPQGTSRKHSRHTLQQSSLLAHLDDRGCLDPQNVFVEFGAGKGELSVYVHEALAAKPSTPRIVLVDRKNFRQKYSVKPHHSDTSDPHSQFERINIDIRDLDLAKVPALQVPDPASGMPTLRPVVAYSKHLCGAATDLTLRCLQRYQEAGGSVAGIAIALCCHHRCKYSMYANPAYLSHPLALSAGDCTNTKPSAAAWNEPSRNAFRLLAAMSSWAINAPPQTQTSDMDCQHHSGLAFAQRGQAGHAVKRMLDLGRLDFVHKGLRMSNAELVYFTHRSASPENLALVASK
ncbi:tRNA:m4X modification enzyme [Coemansia sp. RSA 1933]|nr:tRNA:m4X modification enzyme [Coemansia sp. RSA 1933]